MAAVEVIFSSTRLSRSVHLPVSIMRGRFWFVDGGLSYERVERLTCPTRLDPVPKISLRWQSGQTEDLHFSRMACQMLRNYLGLQLALFIRIDDHADQLAPERLRILARPASFSVRRAGRGDAQIGCAP